MKLIDITAKIRHLRRIAEQTDNDEDADLSIIKDLEKKSSNKEEDEIEHEEEQEEYSSSSDFSGVSSLHDKIISKLDTIYNIVKDEVKKEREIISMLRKIMNVLKADELSEQITDEQQDDDSIVADYNEFLEWAKESKDYNRADNPPRQILDEDIWERAKRAVQPYWDRYDEPWGVVMYVYKQMGGRVRKPRKK